MSFSAFLLTIVVWAFNGSQDTIFAQSYTSLAQCEQEKEKKLLDLRFQNTQSPDTFRQSWTADCRFLTNTSEAKHT